MFALHIAVLVGLFWTLINDFGFTLSKNGLTGAQFGLSLIRWASVIAAIVVIAKLL